MDYLYINAIVKEFYKDLPCGCPFPKEYSGILHSALSYQDCLSNPDIPTVFSFFTLRTKGQEPVMVLSLAGKHTNSASVGRYTQCIGWTWNGELLLKDMGQMLEAGFYSEAEINNTALAGGSFPLPKNRRVDTAVRLPELKPQVKQAIVTTVLLRWLRYEAPLRIAVPRDVDYNSYVRAAVREIYAMLPASLRARAGFCSYMPNDKNVADGVSIGFVPEDMADGRTLSLDGSSAAACAKLSHSTDSIALDTLVQYIANTPTAQLASFFEEIYEDVEGSGDSTRIYSVSAKDYQPIGLSLNLLTTQGTTEQLLPQWKKFFESQQKYPHRMAQRIRRHIRDNLDIGVFCGLVRREWKGGKFQVFEKLKHYQPFCQGNPPLADALWASASEDLLAQGMTYSAMYSEAEKNLRDLGHVLTPDKLDVLFLNARREQVQILSRQSADTLPQIESTLKALAPLEKAVLQRDQLPGAQTLLKEILSLKVSLCSRRNSLIHGQLADRFDRIKAKPSETVAEIAAVLRESQDLLNDVSQAARTPENQMLQNDIQSFMAQKEAFANSSAAKFRIIEDIFAAHHPYFALLAELDKADKSQLEKQHLDWIHNSLRQARPQTLAKYEQDFFSHYHCDLLLCNVSKQPDFICAILVRDICALNRMDIHCSASPAARKTANQIENAIHIAGKISPNHKVQVSWNNQIQDAVWFKDLLQLTHNQASMGDGERLKAVFTDLAEAGSYSAEDIPAAIRMARRCNLKYGWLFLLILRGCFRDCDDVQYRMAYEKILRYSDESIKKTLDSMVDKAKQTQDRDSSAYRILLDVAADHAPKKGGKGMLIALCAMGAAMLGLIALVVILFLGSSDTPEPTEPTVVTQPTVTEPTVPVVYPEEICYYSQVSQAADLLYGNTAADLTFEARAAQVDVLLNLEHETLPQLIVNKYADLRGTTVTVDAATEVSWEEYFFWFCWLHSKDDVDTLLAKLGESAPDPQVLSILQLIHHDLPVQPEEPASTEPASTEPASTGPAMSDPIPSDPAQTTAATDPVQDTTASTEAPLPTLADVRAAITAAAAVPYESSQVHVPRMQLMLAVFGADFSRSFEDHAAQVSGFQLLADPNSPSYQEFMKHYRNLPGDTVVCFDQADIAVTWNEYIFWECWLLARKGVTQIDAATYSPEFQNEVLQVLSLIHNLVDPTEYPANLDELLAAAADTQPANSADASTQSTAGAGETADAPPAAPADPVVEAITSAAGEAFRQMQTVYRAILQGAGSR